MPKRIKLPGLFFERVKTLVIALLILSAMLLAWTNGFVAMLLGSGAPVSAGGAGASSHLSVNGGVSGLYTAEAPFYMAVTGSDGTRIGCKNIGAKTVFPVFSVILGGALGSASDCADISEADWQTALTGENVFFDYLSPLPLAALSRWLGTEISPILANLGARRLCLAPDGQKLELFFSADGKYFSSQTALDASALTSRLDTIDSGYPAAAFAFENRAAYPGIDGSLLLIADGIQSKSAVESKTPPSLDYDAILSAFGMSAGLSRDYIQQDGTRVIIQSSKELYMLLRVYPNGEAVFSRSGFRDSPPPISSAADLIDFAWGVARLGPLSSSGKAELYISGAALDFVSNRHIITFDYVIDGVPVVSAYGPALALTISGGAIESAAMSFREFSYVPGFFGEKPQKQALAAMTAENGEIFLAYETGDGDGLGWIVRK